jgi:hypothetical protein
MNDHVQNKIIRNTILGMIKEPQRHHQEHRLSKDSHWLKLPATCSHEAIRLRCSNSQLKHVMLSQPTIALWLTLLTNSYLLTKTCYFILPEITVWQMATDYWIRTTQKDKEIGYLYSSTPTTKLALTNMIHVWISSLLYQNSL